MNQEIFNKFNDDIESENNDKNNVKNKQIKIKYRLDKVKPNEIGIDNIVGNDNIGGYCKHTINCSYKFLVYKFGNSLGSSLDDKSQTSWIIKVTGSNKKIYYINLYDSKEYKLNLDQISVWNLGDNNYPIGEINYQKIGNLIEFEYKKFLKKIKKENKELEKNTNICLTTNTKTNFNAKFIDEEKYNKMNLELLKYSDDDLASILFVRFKKSKNLLLKDALIIHKSLVNYSNYIKKSYETNTNNNNINICQNTLSQINTNVNYHKKNNIKNKSKYNNKIKKV